MLPNHMNVLDPSQESLQWFLKSSNIETVLFLLKLHGIDISFETRTRRSKISSLLFKMYRGILLFICWVLMAASIRHFIKQVILKRKGELSANFVGIFYSDQIVAICIFVMYEFKFKTRQLTLALRSTVSVAYQFNKTFSKNFKKIRFGVLIILILSVVHSLVYLIPKMYFMIQIHVNNEVKLIRIYNKYYFGMPESVYSTILAAIFEFGLGLLMGSVQLFTSFIILLIYVLKCCFAELNRDFVNSIGKGGFKLRHVPLLQRRHQMVSHAVNAVSAGLSPTLLVLVCVKIMEIVVAYDIIKHLLHDQVVIGFAFQLTALLLITIAYFLIMVIAAGKLYNEVSSFFKYFLRITNF